MTYWVLSNSDSKGEINCESSMSSVSCDATYSCVYKYTSLYAHTYTGEVPSGQTQVLKHKIWALLVFVHHCYLIKQFRCEKSE